VAQGIGAKTPPLSLFIKQSTGKDRQMAHTAAWPRASSLTMILMLAWLALLAWAAPGLLAQEGQAAANPQTQCATCHLNITAQWRNGPHAQAYSNERFQSAWQAQRENPQCLSCHTTGFVLRTGQFEQTAVGCEACHGPTPADHPSAPISMPDAATMCGSCHTTTLNEWERSGHGTPETSCTACHAPHTQQMVAQGSDLCITCHTSTPEGTTHVTHAEQACADCHWHRALDPSAHFVSGNLLPSGHDASVLTVACTDCHAQADQAWQQRVAQGVTVSMARMEFEARVAQNAAISREAERQSSSLVQTSLGLMTGGFVSLGVVSLWARRRR